MGKPKKKFQNESNIASMEDARQKTKKTFTPNDLIRLNHTFTLTPPQKDFVYEFKSGTPIIAQVGCAGTGKTLLSIHQALEAVFEEGSPYHHVKIVRSAVQSREQGFLPGDNEEKMEVYQSPYKAILNEVLWYKNKNFENLQALGYLSFESTSFLRGETWDNTIVVLDEMQNATYHELMTVITRLGNYSRIILCGDHKQTDLSRKNDVSGFEQLMKLFDRMSEEDTSVVEYTTDDIVRSGIVKRVLEAEYNQ